jgi:hypothetical protein
MTLAGSESLQTRRAAKVLDTTKAALTTETCKRGSNG